MSDRLKNIITNIMGLLMLITAVYGLMMDMITITAFGVLTLIALALFMFKNSTSVEYIKKFLDKKLK